MTRQIVLRLRGEVRILEGAKSIKTRVVGDRPELWIEYKSEPSEFIGCLPISDSVRKEHVVFHEIMDTIFKAFDSPNSDEVMVDLLRFDLETRPSTANNDGLPRMLTLQIGSLGDVVLSDESDMRSAVGKRLSEVTVSNNFAFLNFEPT